MQGTVDLSHPVCTLVHYSNFLCFMCIIIYVHKAAVFKRTTLAVLMLYTAGYSQGQISESTCILRLGIYLQHTSISVAVIAIAVVDSVIACSCVT